MTAAAVIPETVLNVRGLATGFSTGQGWFRAVDGVDVSVARGETVALVGESGSGKSVTSLSIMGLLPKTGARVLGGQILFRGRDGAERDLLTLDERAMRALRGDEIAMIFQEPMSSLNPTRSIGSQVAEVLRLHRRLSGGAAWNEAVRMLEQVEMTDARRRAGAYPHELSGGMRQRVMIAMALTCRPSLLLADEPTTALDVTVQAQILRLIRNLQDEIGMGVLFITHNMGVVAEIADRVAVMYGGQVVEAASVDVLFDSSRHPYTRGLMASLPGLNREAEAGRRLPTIRGFVVDPRHPPPGCRFSPRCDLALDACAAGRVEMAFATPSHQTRCLRWSELS
jgi:oligopeptide/dipeptide ABC transporter ATP-binding protein